MSVFRRFTDIYIFVMLLLFPLFTGPQGYASITRWKFLFFAAATLLWLAALLLYALLRRLRPRSLAAMGVDSAAITVYLAVCCLSALCSPFFPDTLLGAGRWDGLVPLLLYGAIFLGVRAFGRLRPAHLYALGTAVVLCTAVAVPQLLGYNPLGLFPGALDYYDAHTYYTGEFLGTIGNVDLLSAFLCLSTPLLAAAFVLDGRRAPLLLPAGAGLFLLLSAQVAAGPVALGGCLLLAAPILLCSRARLCRGLLALGALAFAAFWALALDFAPESAALRPDWTAWAVLALGAVSLAAASLVYLRRNRPEPPPGIYTRFFLAADLVLVALGAVAIYFWPGESGTLYELSRLLHGELQDSFGSSRIRIWRETLSLFPQRPLLGGGPGTISLRLDVTFSRYVPETGQVLRTYVDNAHNEYLTILTDTGLLGLGAYLSALALSFRSWLRRRRETLLPAVGCGLAAYWIHGFFGLGLCLTAPVFWLLWGLADTKSAALPDAPAISSDPAGSE